MEKITFVTDDGGKEEFYVEEQTRINGVNYILVSDSKDDEANAYILKDISTDTDAEAEYVMVEDDTEFDAVSAERSDYDEYLIRLDEFLHSLHNVQRVEVLPYHTLGVFKWETLGIPYKLEGINPPTKERVENANKLLHTAEYTGYLK